jgi:hypothetical protein
MRKLWGVNFFLDLKDMFHTIESDKDIVGLDIFSDVTLVPACPMSVDSSTPVCTTRHSRCRKSKASSSCFATTLTNGIENVGLWKYAHSFLHQAEMTALCT